MKNKDIRQRLCEANLFFREQIKANSFDSEYFEEDVLLIHKNLARNAKYMNTNYQSMLILSPTRNLFTKFAINQYNLARMDY